MPRSMCSEIPNPKLPVSEKFFFRSSYSFTFRPRSRISSCKPSAMSSEPRLHTRTRFWAPNSNVHSYFFVASYAKGSDCIPGFACRGTWSFSGRFGEVGRRDATKDKGGDCAYCIRASDQTIVRALWHCFMDPRSVSPNRGRMASLAAS